MALISHNERLKKTFIEKKVFLKSLQSKKFGTIDTSERFAKNLYRLTGVHLFKVKLMHILEQHEIACSEEFHYGIKHGSLLVHEEDAQQAEELCEQAKKEFQAEQEAGFEADGQSEETLEIMKWAAQNNGKRISDLQQAIAQLWTLSMSYRRGPLGKLYQDQIKEIKTSYQAWGKK